MSLSLILFFIGILVSIGLFIIKCTTCTMKNYIRLHLLVSISTLIMVIPIKVISILSFTNVIMINIISLTLTIFIARFLTSIFRNTTFPPVHSILFSVLASLIIINFLHPLIIHFFYLIHELVDLDFQYYFYIFSYAYNLFLCTDYVDGVFFAKRTPEVQNLLEEKRKSVHQRDRKCFRMFGMYNAEIDPSIKKANLRNLLELVRDQRDECKDIDNLAGRKSSYNAFKKRSYSVFVTKFIENLKKK